MINKWKYFKRWISVELTFAGGRKSQGEVWRWGSHPHVSWVSVPQAAAKCSRLTCVSTGAASFHVTGEEWWAQLSVCLNACLQSKFLQLLCSWVDFFYEVLVRCRLTGLILKNNSCSFSSFMSAGVLEQVSFCRVQLVGFLKVFS